MSKGNTLSYIILFGWPVLSIWLYRQKSLQFATLVTIVGGFMVLAVSTSVDFPLIPPLGKHSMPVFSAILGCWFIKGRRIKYFANKGGLKILVLMLFFGAFITAELNSDRVIVGGRFLPGLTLHDAISAVIGVFIQITPFFIGRQFFRSYQDQLLMFRFLVIVGLIYSMPMLYEIRMSPQLHTIFYGYFPHSFLQQARDGGFRPVVFMGHGLLVAFFTVCTLTAATVLWKVGEKVHKFSAVIVIFYLLVVLVLCKSMASIIYGVFAVLMIKTVSYKNQFRAAALLAILFLSYPTMSIMKIFPHQGIVEFSRTYIGDQRASSLSYRFDNENILLDHGRERFLFGWGGWGRNRVYDAETGKDKSVTDGGWVLTFGITGIVGFIAKFGLLAMSIFTAKIASMKIKEKNELNMLAGHALLVSLIMIDQLPNASLAPWLWLLAGILLGRSEEILINNKKISVSLN